MRTAKIRINGKEYLLCFSTRVMRDCTERYGGIEKIGEALSGGDTVKMLDECFWLLAQMMAAGAKYAAMEGLPNPEPLGCDDLYDLCSVDDMLDMKAHIMETISEGCRREIEVETEQGKNAQTTRTN
jgi:hypothetical protein